MAAHFPLSVFPKGTSKSTLCLKSKCTLDKCCMSSLLCLSADRTSCFSFPAPTTYLRCRQSGKKNYTYFYSALRAKKKLQPSYQQETSQRFCHFQRRQRCHAIGFTVNQWEVSIGGECLRVEEVRLHAGGWGGKWGILAAGPDVFVRGSRNG